MSARLVVLASGSGTNLQAIIDATGAGQLGATVVAVISDVASAYAIERASAAGIPAVVVVPAADETRRDYDVRLAAAVSEFQPDWVVLAGWMRLLRMDFLDRFPQRVVNLHPALPGDLPGLHAIERAYAQFVAGERRNTGVMVHLVPDEGIDTGPVLRTCGVPIEPGDTLEALASRVHAAEHLTLVEALRDLCHADHSASFLEEAHPA
jgi:phosphoribosylglycinamide formyltransferase-1